MQSVPAGTGTTGEAETEPATLSIALGCFASICRDRLADQLLAFSRACPSVDIGVHEMSRGSLIPALRAGTLSLAVLPGGEEAGVCSKQVWHDRVMVVMAPDHPLAGQAVIRAADLGTEGFLVSRQQFGGDMHRFLARLILPDGPALNATIIDIGLPRLLVRVASGEGVALVCESHLEHVGADVVARPVEAPAAVFPVRAYWNGRTLERPLRDLVDSLGR